MANHQDFLLPYSNTVLAREEKLGFPALTEAEKTFVCIWTLEAQVNNGGFDQFYFNTSGDIATETVRALVQIGAAHTADLVLRANGVFPDTLPSKDRNARQAQLAGLAEDAIAVLNELDDLFYAYTDDLDELLYEYVVQHRDEFPPA